MTSPAFEIQTLLYSTLSNDPTLKTLIDDVYDTVPSSPFGTHAAYISFGPSDMTPTDPEGIEDESHNVQLDVWSRAVGGQTVCKKICSAVKAALHLRKLTLTDNAFCECELTLNQVMRDPDGLTIHGIMQFTITVEVH